MLSNLLNPSSPISLSSSSSHQSIFDTMQEVINNSFLCSNKPGSTSSQSSSVPPSTVTPAENPSKRKGYSWPYQIPIFGNCLSLIGDQSSGNMCLRVTLLRNNCLSHNLSKGKILVEIQKLDVYRELSTLAHVRYQQQTLKSGDSGVCWVEPRRNYTHVIIKIPDFKANDLVRNIIGNSNASVEVGVYAQWENVVKNKCSLDEIIESAISRGANYLKRPSDSRMPPDCSVNQPPPPKTLCLQKRQDNALAHNLHGIHPSVFNDRSNNRNTTSRNESQISLPLAADMNGSYPVTCIPGYNFVTTINCPSFIPNASPPVLPSHPPFRHVRLQVNMSSRSSSSSLTMKSLATCFLSNFFICVPAFDIILKYLDLHDRLNCRLVCESWSRLVDSSKCWREVRVNTSNPVPGRCLNKGIAPSYFKRCEKLYLNWECNRNFGGLPISDLHDIIALCPSSLHSLGINFCWNSRDKDSDIPGPATAIKISLDPILMRVPNLKTLSISSPCSDICSVNLIQTDFCNSSVKYLEVKNIHEIPNMLHIASRNLHSIQTLHLRSFHLCPSLENMPMQRIHELILDCECGELQMNHFDWLKNMSKLSTVSIVNVLCSENLFKLVKSLGELQTVMKLSLKEHVPKWALSSNEILANQLPKTLRQLQWDVIVVPSDKNYTTTSLSTSMYADAHFLRCIIQTQFRNEDIDINVTVYDPSTPS